MPSFTSSGLYALGCAVCGAARKESEDAFLVGTALLTFLPLLLIAVVGFWFARKASQHRQRELQEEAWRSATPSGGPGSAA